MTDEKGNAPSEFDIIERFFAPLSSGYPGAFVLRDDAAVVDVSEDQDIVVTLDTLVAGVHFFGDDAARDIAEKCLAVNMSDLAAKGCEPTVYFLSLALPKDCVSKEADWLQDFSYGLEAAQARYGCRLAGGDTVATPGPLTISICAHGVVPRGEMVRRDGARAGDKLYVSGTIGDGALGLLMRQKPEFFEIVDLSEAEEQYLLNRYLRPQPRLALAPSVREFASASMDVSDGLVCDLEKLCAASGVGAKVYAEKIPISTGAKKICDAEHGQFSLIVTGGDDYELLVAVPPEKTGAFERAAGRVEIQISQIGEISPAASGVGFYGFDGAQVAFDKDSYSHF